MLHRLLTASEGGVIYAKKKPLARLLILFKYFFNIHPHSKDNLRQLDNLAIFLL